MAVSSNVVTSPPCTIGPEDPVKQYSIGASHSITASPSACSIPRYPRVTQTCGATGADSTQLRRSSGNRLACELLSEHRLSELADGCLRDLLDEDDRVRQPPLGETGRDEVAQLLGGRGRPRLQHDDGKRALLPFL